MKPEKLKKCETCTGAGRVTHGRLNTECDACHGSGYAAICHDCGEVIVLEKDLVAFKSRRLHTLDECAWTNELKAAGSWKSPDWEPFLREAVKQTRLRQV